MARPARWRGTAALAACLVAAIAVVPAQSATAGAGSPWRALAAGPAPTSNPLEGFIPYAGSYATFPYTMEWFYLPLNAVVTGPQSYDWSTLEAQLNAVASRGHQSALRFYLDYPGKPSGIPHYLLDDGLVTHAYPDYGNNGLSVSPDYDNPSLDAALDGFIAALGARYDGDPRVGFLQLGLLGFWGEWHTYPYDGYAQPQNWFASEAEQLRILQDYDAAFNRTRLQVRYPSTDNASLDMGYHDDSFAVETLPGIGWHFMDKMQRAGATAKWLTEPVGGELRPEIQGCIFDTPADCPIIESGADNDFPGSVAATHASWLLNQHAFDPGYPAAIRAAALAGSQSLGYLLRVAAISAPPVAVHQPLTVGVRIENLGIAPFYYDWPVQIAAIDQHHRTARIWTTNWHLTTVKPGTPTTWTSTVDTSDLHPGRYTLLLHATNPLPGGVPLRFANADQDRTLTGWLTLGTTVVA